MSGERAGDLDKRRAMQVLAPTPPTTARNAAVAVRDQAEPAAARARRGGRRAGKNRRRGVVSTLVLPYPESAPVA